MIDRWKTASSYDAAAG